MNIFITGIGSGLGKALAQEYLEAGERVFALSRHIPNEFEKYDNLYCFKLNLFAVEEIKDALNNLLGKTNLDIAILNAGILGEIKDMSDTSLHEIEDIMKLNVYANKVILDFLKGVAVNQIVAISSGASISGARGWNAYSLSKAALNMLIKLYANEMPNTHLISLAPGLIQTPMMEHILKYGNDKKYPTIKRLKNSQRLNPKDAAKLLIDSFKKLLEFPSGEYIDIRNI